MKEIDRKMFEHKDDYLEGSFINYGTINRQPINRKTGKTGMLPPTIVGKGTIICPDAVVYAGTTIGENCFIADGASIREGCNIGNNTLIGRMSVVEQNVWIGNNVKINSNVHITGEMSIGNNCFFGPFVSTMNDTYMGIDKNVVLRGPTLGHHVYVGGGATILPGVIIVSNVIIGAGALITKNINESHTVWGSKPAEEITMKVDYKKLFPGIYTGIKKEDIEEHHAYT